jgi:hypothetical protein
MKANWDTAQARHDAGRGLQVVARVGYTAKGIVYCVVGALSLMVAFGEGGQLTDGRGAIEKLGAQPFGNALLWAAALGLACYALWSAVRALLDPENHPHGKKTVLKRLGYGLAALSHGSLALYAAGRAIGGLRSSGNGTESLVSQAMGYPLGRVAVAIAGLIAVVFGGYQLYRAIRNKPETKLDESRMGALERRTSHFVGRLGVAARGLVFPVIGASLVVAARRANPSEASSLGEALSKLASGPFGEALLTFVAAGLFAYGLHQLFVAKYAILPRRV